MRLDYVPLLRIQRGLHDLPPGPGRFQKYLRTISRPDGTDIDLVPLLAANPMAKGHVATCLDGLLAVDADGVGARAAADAAAALCDVPGEYRAALVVADDLLGGGTNRFDYELAGRSPSPDHKRFWVTGLLWSSETPTADAARTAMSAAVYRTAYVVQHGPARTLGALLAQEGYAMARAGCIGPTLDADDLAYTRKVLAPVLDAGDKRTLIECLFGDEAARSLGFSPWGLSPWAGLALALHDATTAPGS